MTAKIIPFPYDRLIENKIANLKARERELEAIISEKCRDEIDELNRIDMELSRYENNNFS